MENSVEIRTVESDEAEAYIRAISTTFLEDQTDGLRYLAWRQGIWDAQRTWAAWADGRIVGTLRTRDQQVSVPGPDGTAVDVAADALTSVTVSATHRRRGLLRRMLTASLEAAHDRGDPVSILIAAEWPIYGRFGYWPAAAWADRTLYPRRPGARLRIASTGRVRQVDVPELRTIAPTVFDVARTHRAGHLDRLDAAWDRYLLPEYREAGHKEAVHIVHEGDDGVDGFVSWRPVKDAGWVDGGTIAVDHLFATDQDAYSALWGYLLEMDILQEISLDSRPVDEPLPYLLLDGRSVQTTSVNEGIWLRLLDVPAALSARSYSAPGRLCFDVVDDDIGGYATGRYLLETGADGAECRRAPELTPQLSLSQRALAGVYLGQPSLRVHRAAGLVDELTPGAIQLADSMFTTGLLPWVGTHF